MHDEALTVLGEAIRRRRLACGMTGIELAALAGMHRNYLASVEQGQRNVSVVNLQRIAVALGMTLAELISDAFEA